MPPPPPTSAPRPRSLILAKAREHPPASTARVWMKSAIAEREAGDAPAERSLLQVGRRRAGAGRAGGCLLLSRRLKSVEGAALRRSPPPPLLTHPLPPPGCLQEGIRRFPYFWKLHIMLGQLEERLGALLQGLLGCMEETVQGVAERVQAGAWC